MPGSSPPALLWVAPAFTDSSTVGPAARKQG
jgi:hypothetical protein